MAYEQNRSYSKFKFSRKGKRRGIIAGLVCFALTQATMGTLLGWIPIIGSIVRLLGVGISVVVGLVVAVMNTELDVATPRQQRKLEQKLESIPQTGDSFANETITKGQAMLRQIREANNAIPDPDITRKLYSIEHLCIQIFRTVSENPDKASRIRKFMNYYLPTTVKMLDNYRTMTERGVSYTEVSRAKEALGRGLSMIETATQKQLDSLFQENAMDVATDIDVLEQMLKRDGFADVGTANAPMLNPAQVGQTPPATARTAAAAQMGSQSHPTLNVDPSQMNIYGSSARKQQTPRQ